MLQSVQVVLLFREPLSCCRRAMLRVHAKPPRSPHTGCRRYQSIRPESIRRQTDPMWPDLRTGASVRRRSADSQARNAHTPLSSPPGRSDSLPGLCPHQTVRDLSRRNGTHRSGQVRQVLPEDAYGQRIKSRFFPFGAPESFLMRWKCLSNQQPYPPSRRRAAKRWLQGCSAAANPSCRGASGASLPPRDAPSGACFRADGCPWTMGGGSRVRYMTMMQKPL